jgi:hypothetical protein
MKATEFNAETGIQTVVHANDNGWTIEKRFDAEPLLQDAEAGRQATQGERWGDGRKVGTIPLAILGQFMRQDGGLDTKRLTAWLRENPAFVSYEPFLRVQSKL